MIRSPNETFATSAHRADMERIAYSEAFLIACDYAILILTERQNNPIDPTGLAKIIGAREVIEILKTIHEKPKPIDKTRCQQLNYNA